VKKQELENLKKDGRKRLKKLLKEKKIKKNKIFEMIMAGTFILIVGFISVFLISRNYSTIYNALSSVTKIIMHKDLNGTVEFFRGGR